MAKNKVVLCAVIIVLTGISFYAPAFAVEAAPPSSYSGDFLTRSTLTGDWGGARNDLAKKGLTFELEPDPTGMSGSSAGEGNRAGSMQEWATSQSI